MKLIPNVKLDKILNKRSEESGKVVFVNMLQMLLCIKLLLLGLLFEHSLGNIEDEASKKFTHEFSYMTPTLRLPVQSEIFFSYAFVVYTIFVCAN